MLRMPKKVVAEKKVRVLYGSNTGNSEDMALDLNVRLGLVGYDSSCTPLDAFVGEKDPAGLAEALADAPVIIITPTYNGYPPDNAVIFKKMLTNDLAEAVKADPKVAETMKKVDFCVFGTGNTGWATTYQGLPTFIDLQLQALGANAICQRGAANFAVDPEGDFESWVPQCLEALGKGLSSFAESSPVHVCPIEIEYVQESESKDATDFEAHPPRGVDACFLGKIEENRELQSSSSERLTRHIKFAVPEGKEYVTGDHLHVLPVNRKEIVDAYLNRFGLDGEKVIIIKAKADQSPIAKSMPLNAPVSVRTLFRDF